MQSTARRRLAKYDLVLNACIWGEAFIAKAELSQAERSRLRYKMAQLRASALIDGRACWNSLDEQTEPASIKRLAYKSHSILPHIRQLVELSYETKQSDAVRLAALLSLVSVEFDCRLNAPNEDWQRVDANQSSWNLTDSVKEIKQILDASKNQATLLSLQPLAHEALLTWAEWTMQRDSTSSNQVMESLYWLKPRVQDRTAEWANCDGSRLSTSSTRRLSACVRYDEVHQR